ncbi:MAG: hypothetical protein AABY14_03965, partial [Nanoarchaeota archaeon]
KQYNLNADVDAVISAIRRYPYKENFSNVTNSISDVLKNSRISTKTKIVSISMKREHRTLELLQKIFPLITFGRGEVLRISEGRELIKILVDQDKLEKFKEIIPENLIVEIRQNLSELSIKFGNGSRKTVGVLATILSQIAINEINIVEAISCFPEYMIFVDEKDILKTYEVLLNFL